MTFEEAIKILKKEFFGIEFKKFDKPLKFEEKLWIRNEKPEILEALHIVAKNGISVSVPETALRIRSIITKKMRAGEGAPAPVSGTPLSAAEGMKLQWKDNKNTDKNPALKEAASQFNDALLDEQTKKIDELTKEKVNLEDQITILDAFKKHNDSVYRSQIQRLGKEIARLNKIIHKKNLKIAEKDEVITDLGKELKAQKDLVDHISKLRDSAKINLNLRMKECEKLKDELEEANNLGLVGSKDGNGIFDKMVVVGVDVAKEGADHSDVIVLCKDKENEEAVEELSKVLNDVIDRFLLFGEIITKEE